MSNTQAMTTPHLSPTRRWVMVLLIMAFLLKALVPIGYMASNQHQPGLPFAIQLCTADGIIMVSPTGEPLAPEHEEGSGMQACTCSSNLTVPILVLALALFLLVTTPSLFLPRITPQPWRARLLCCGPLGSRAPPQITSLS